MVLFGNKSDLKSERQVSYEEGRDLAAQWNCPFFEGSAKDNIGIDEVFESLSEQVLKMQKRNKKDNSKCIIS